MHGHGSARTERVHSNVFWDEPKSICTNTSGLAPEERDDVQGADRVEPLVVVRVIDDRGGPWAPMFTHAEEDVNTLSNQAG